jgi:hypothetical protein
MPGPSCVAEPERAELLRRVGECLAAGEDRLEIVADQILGLESRIDLLARDAAGQVVLVLLAGAGEDLLRLGDALAQRSWATPRVRDWAKLAPSLGLRAELGVRTLLLAPSFDPRTLAAALSLGPELIELWGYRCAPTPVGVSVSLERPLGHEAGARERPPARPLSTFRSGLRPEDLAAAPRGG